MKKAVFIRINLITILIIMLLPVCVSAKTAKHCLTDTQISLSVGEKVQLEIPNVNIRNVSWTIKNKKLCKISKKGILSAKKQGNTIIVAKYGDISMRLSVSIYPKNGFYNRIIGEDDSLIVYLKAIKNGQIYLKIENKSNEDYWITDIQYDYNGDMFDDDLIIQEVPHKTWYALKVRFYDNDADKTIKYNYIGGMFEGVIHYHSNYSNDENNPTKYKAMKFKFKA